jgi:hypothetical protein
LPGRATATVARFYHSGGLPAVLSGGHAVLADAWPGLAKDAPLSWRFVALLLVNAPVPVFGAFLVGHRICPFCSGML